MDSEREYREIGRGGNGGGGPKDKGLNCMRGRGKKRKEGRTQTFAERIPIIL